jgi:phage shock protein PspC (stress-responsive transcriptional regulator)
MQKVMITVNLNGNTHVVDEGGYERLRTYLDRAAASLASNPDRDEIVTDLERSIAEKFLRYVGHGKSVVTEKEVESVLREIGPVHGEHAAATGDTSEKTDSPPTGSPRRLHQIREGAMVSGVCNGIGAYFGIDPTFVRVAFVLLALFHGVGIALYVLLMVIVPYAKTSEQLAAAQGGSHGIPYRVQRFVEKWKAKVFSKAKPAGS